MTVNKRKISEKEEMSWGGKVRTIEPCPCVLHWPFK